jgi:hypothetical protein
MELQRSVYNGSQYAEYQQGVPADLGSADGRWIFKSLIRALKSQPEPTPA